jgi:hypothetical protein
MSPEEWLAQKKAEQKPHLSPEEWLATQKGRDLSEELFGKTTTSKKAIVDPFDKPADNENLGAAIVGGLAITLLFSTLGVVITRMLLGKRKLTNSAVHTGIKWAAYSILPVMLASSHQFIKKGVVDGLVSLLVILIFFPAVAYILGYIFRLIWPATTVNSLSVESSLEPKTTNNHPPTAAKVLPKANTPTEEFWAAASTEFDGPDRRPGLWARVFSESEGNLQLAKAKYLRHRADELQQQNSRS